MNVLICIKSIDNECFNLYYSFVYFFGFEKYIAILLEMILIGFTFNLFLQLAQGKSGTNIYNTFLAQLT
jgi:hypothetical protein